MSESFQIDMSFSSPMVLEKKNFNGPIPLLSFCDYLPFEVDLTLNLNNLESPSPNDNLLHV
jgi:hypothetical protein